MVKVLNNPAETKAWWLVAVHVCPNCATAYKLEPGDAFEIPPSSAMHASNQVASTCPDCGDRVVTSWPVAKAP